MPFSLIIAQGKERGRAFRFRADAVSIGRDAGNDVVLNHPSVSRAHARIERRGPQWALLDRGSANGTGINGRRVVAEVHLREGDRIAVGTVVFEFRRATATALLRARWTRLRPPARAMLVAAPVVLFGICVAAHVAPADAQATAAGEPRLPDGEALFEAPADPEAARAAYERGLRKLRERRVAPRNLYDAWKAFAEARDLLEGVAARPAFYGRLLDLISDCARDLERDCRRLSFGAGRLETYGEEEKAQQAWREVLLHFPGDDPGGCREKAQERLLVAQPEATAE